MMQKFSKGRTRPISAVIYARGSALDNDHEDSSTNLQVEECRKYAASKGISVISEYVDFRSSSRIERSRPEFSAMIDEALSPHPLFQVILVYDHSRFSRNLVESEEAYLKLRVNGVKVKSVTQMFDIDVILGNRKPRGSK